MAQAIMDPEKVRRFAEELHRFNTDLENRLVLLQARFTALGDTWQDQEHANACMNRSRWSRGSSIAHERTRCSQQKSPT